MHLLTTLFHSFSKEKQVLTGSSAPKLGHFLLVTLGYKSERDHTSPRGGTVYMPCSLKCAAGEQARKVVKRLIKNLQRRPNYGLHYLHFGHRHM